MWVSTVAAGGTGHPAPPATGPCARSRTRVSLWRRIPPGGSSGVRKELMDTEHTQHGASWAAARQATLHCLTGCAIGEVGGMVIGTAAGLSNGATVVLSIAL